MNITLLRRFALALAFFSVAHLTHGNPEDFTVQSVTDSKTFKLSEAKGKFVALHFLLKTECPICIRHTREYAQKSSGDARVVHVFLKPDTDEEIRKWAAGLRADAGAPTIYRDPEAKLAKEYNIPHGYRFHGQTVHYPALVLLDGAGKEVFRYVGTNNTDRFGYGRFEEKLAELTRPSPR